METVKAVAKKAGVFRGDLLEVLRPESTVSVAYG